MRLAHANPDPECPEPGCNAVVVHLSGPGRGKTDRLTAAAMYVEALDARTVGITAADRPTGGRRLASFYQSGRSYELVAEPNQRLWVNGRETTQQVLATGDVIELDAGPVLRFRLYPPEVGVHKSPAEVFSDCLDCSRRDTRSAWKRIPALVRDVVSGLATQTSLWFRGGVIVTLLALGGLVFYQSLHTRDLEQRIAQEQQKFAGLAALLRRVEMQALTRDELETVREEIRQGLQFTERRVAALEAKTAATTRIVADASPSVVFIVGGFGFVDPATGRALRLAVGADGKPLRTPLGGGLVTLEGDGPPVEVNFTGTAFVVHGEGYLLTNRHVAQPWESETAMPGVLQLGLKPVMRRMLGYVPGLRDPVDVRLVGTSDAYDIAVLRGDGDLRQRKPLTLAAVVPAAGDEVILLGYPTGIRALLARAGEPFVKALSEQPGLDFWAIARELSKAHLINPLASRGIVGQVSADAVVYDAQTTQGGSGGPVLSVGGEVLAINQAVLANFGGSNLGVPIRHARELMRSLDIRSPE